MQQTKDKVKMLIQLADNFVEKGHMHVTELKKCVTAVDKRYRDFSLRMGKYRCSLESALGISSEVLDLYRAYYTFLTALYLIQMYNNVDFIVCVFQDNKDLELDIIPASLTDPEVKLRDPNHEVNEEKRKSARKKE